MVDVDAEGRHAWGCLAAELGLPDTLTFRTGGGGCISCLGSRPVSGWGTARAPCPRASMSTAPVDTSWRREASIEVDEVFPLEEHYYSALDEFAVSLALQRRRCKRSPGRPAAIPGRCGMTAESLAPPRCLRVVLPPAPGLNGTYHFARIRQYGTRVYKSARAQSWAEEAHLCLRAAGFQPLPDGPYWVALELVIQTALRATPDR